MDSRPIILDAPPTNPIAQAFGKMKRSLVYVGLFSLCSNILMLALPLYSLQVFDRVISSHSYETLVMLTVITIAAFLFYTLFVDVRSVILNRISDWMDVTISPELITNAVSKSAITSQTSAGQMLRDLTTIRSFIAGQGVATLFDAPWSIFFLLVVCMISPLLGLVTLIGAVLLLLFALLTEFITRQTVKKANRILLKANLIAETASKEAETIEAMGMMPNLVSSWRRQNQEGLEIQSKVNERLMIIQSTSRFVRMVVQIATTGFGAYLVLEHEITTGGMIAGSMLAARAMAPFEAAIGTWKLFVGARDAYQRIVRSLFIMPNVRGTMQLPAPRGHVVVENLFYKPMNREAHIIKGVSLQLMPGESLGIIGPSAAGKSTLAKLIAGILPPTHGTVRLDGAETFKWNRQDLGQYIGYMPQNVELFHGTIKDNIARMDVNAPAEKVIAAAQLAGVHEMVLRLPRGYESDFVPGDQSLSPGQRQRIALARALYSNPTFVILDEPNGNLDSDGERALVECMARLKSLRINYIVVAHRPSIVSNVDKLLMLRSGAVEAFGPRDQVLQRYTTPGGQRSIQENKA